MRVMLLALSIISVSVAFTGCSGEGDSAPPPQEVQELPPTTENDRPAESVQ